MVTMLLGLMVLASCGSDDDGAAEESDGTAEPGSAGSGAEDAGTGDSTAPGDDGTEGTNEPGDAEAGDATDEALDLDATLRYMALPPVTIDPHRQTSVHEGTFTFAGYDRLVQVTPEGTAVPGLAESWEFSDDGSTLTFHLRDGAVFHDGSPVNAEAVTASLDRALSLEGSSVAGDLQAIESVEAVDELTVQLNLRAGGAELPLILAYNAGAIINPAEIENGDLENTMPGAGPYEMVEYVPGTRMVFERFEDYWDPDVPKLARIEITLNTDSTAAFNALRAGEVDASAIQPPRVEAAESEGFIVDKGEGLGFHQVQLNRSVEPFDDVRVRQAINHAIDAEAIFEATAFGYGSVNHQPFPQDYVAYNDEIGDLYPYDPERARELLADAGYPDGFSFEAVAPQGSSPPVAEAVQAQLEEVGLDMDLRVLEGAQFAPTFFGGEVPVGIYTWTGRPDPRQTFSQLWSEEGFANPGSHSTPEFMAALEAAGEPQDEESEQLALQAVTGILMEEALAVPIYNYFNLEAHSDRVVGIDRGVISVVRLRQMGIKAEG